MFEGADDDLVTGSDQMFQSVGEQIQRFRRAAGEYDFSGRSSVQPFRPLDARVFVLASCAFGGLVLGSVPIGVAAVVVAAESIDPRLRLLCRGGAVVIGV